MGELFLEGVPGGESRPLLLAAAAGEGDNTSAELLFGPLPHGQSATGDAEAWQVWTDFSSCTFLLGTAA